MLCFIAELLDNLGECVEITSFMMSSTCFEMLYTPYFCPFLRERVSLDVFV